MLNELRDVVSKRTRDSNYRLSDKKPRALLLDHTNPFARINESTIMFLGRYGVVSIMSSCFYLVPYLNQVPISIRAEIIQMYGSSVLNKY